MLHGLFAEIGEANCAARLIALMLLLVSCWEGLIRRPLTACVLLATGSFREDRFTGRFVSRFKKASFNNIGSSQFQVRSFKNVFFRFPKSYRDVRFNTLLPSYGDVRCDTLLPSYRDVWCDTSLQLFEYVQFVKTLPYSSCASSSTSRCRH